MSTSIKYFNSGIYSRGNKTNFLIVNMFLIKALRTPTRSLRTNIFRQNLSAAASKKDAGDDMALVGKQHDANMRLCLKILNSMPDDEDDGLTDEERAEYH